MPEWLRLLLMYGTLVLFVGLFIGMIAWLFGGPRR